MCIIIILLHRKKFKDKTSMIKIHTVYTTVQKKVLLLFFFSGTRSIFTNNSYGYYFLIWDTTKLPQLCSRIKKKKKVAGKIFYVIFIIIHFRLSLLRHLCVTFPLR